MLKTKAVVKKLAVAKAKAKPKADAVKKPAVAKAKAKPKAVVKKPATVAKEKAKPKAVVKPKPRKLYKGGDIQENNIRDLLTAFFDFRLEYVEHGYYYPGTSSFQEKVINIGLLIVTFKSNLNIDSTDGFNNFKIDIITDPNRRDNDIINSYSGAVETVINLLNKLDNMIFNIIDIIKIDSNKFNNIYRELKEKYKDKKHEDELVFEDYFS